MRWILTGVLGAILVAAAGIAVLLIWQWQMRAPLASLVPAERTLAFFPRTTLSELQKTYASWIPQISELPRSEGWMSVAFVETAAGRTAWVIDPTDETSFGDTPAEIRLRGKSVVVGAGTESADVGIREGETPLSASPSFLSLIAETVTQDWGYVHTVPSGEADRRVTLLFGAPTGEAVLERRGEKDALLTYAVTGIDGSPVRFAFPDALPAETFCLGSASPETFLRLLVEDGDPIITQSERLTETERLLGADLSLQYDLLPLLKRPAVGCIRDENGRRDVLLSGEIEDVSAWDALALRLHDGFRDRASKGYVDRRTVDGKYAYAVVKDAMSDLRTDSSTRNGWSVSETPLTASGGLFTARLRNRFILATAPDLFATGTAPALRPLDGLSAGSSELARFAGTTFPPLFGPLRSVYPEGSRFTWTFGVSGGIARLAVRAE